MKVLALVLALLLLHSTAQGRRRRMKTVMNGRIHNIQNDAILTVEPIPPDTVTGQCTCECCQPPPEPYTQPKCANDLVVAIDSSACFRDHHARMMRFLKKLVRRIGRNPNLQYGGEETRLALMQFSSDIVFPLELSAFEDYTNPSSKKRLMEEINQRMSSLEFLGEGSFLNKALNATVNQIRTNPRPNELLNNIPSGKPRPVVIVMTNGKSHPSVTIKDIEYSIEDLRSAGVTVIPVAVTRECHVMSTDVWNEGLCPDTVTLKKLAEVGRSDGGSFMEMTAMDTIPDILNILEACYPKTADYTQNLCNNCTCSCELPVGPKGPPGPRGPKGDFVQGEPGEEGPIGPKGEVGENGDIGPKGLKGNDGDKGVVGPKGNYGEKGFKGDPGVEGEPGLDGPRGEKGKPGIEGPKGRKGELGPKGMIGDKGMVGDKGEIGRKGEYGNKGDIGPKGVKGDKGMSVKGTPGPPGPEGPLGGYGSKGGYGDKGDKGKPGLCGTPGPAGKPGFEGVKGVDGMDGIAGPPGIQGRNGEPGVPGDKGATGEPGFRGLPGNTGLTGERGLEGPEGKRGHKGEKGEPSNEPGPSGSTGQNGQKGEPGYNGADGRDGPEGPSGRQGPRGQRGGRGPPGDYNLEELRVLISEIVRELLPGECVPAEPSNVCHEYPIDLAFLIDGSDSIDRGDFDQIKQWILHTVDSFRPGARKTPLQLFVVQFSEQTQIELQEYINSTSDDVRDTVENIEQMRSGTKTYRALRFLNRNVYPLMRRNSFKILITMTDGDASEDRDVIAINEARDDYNMMVAVGVGEKINKEELADFGKNENIFSVDDFAALEGIIIDIVNNICSNIGEIALSGSNESRRNGDGCYDTLEDLVFVLDGSSSVGEEGFALIKDFLTTVMNEFKTVGREGTEVAIIQYNNSPRLEFAFKLSTSKDAILAGIDELKYLGGNTETGLALEYTRERIDPLHPGRVVILITDGKSQDDIIKPAQALKNAGATVFAIGVGEADIIELVEIASSPTSEYVFTVDSYAEISTIKDSLVEKICLASSGTYKNDDKDTSIEEEHLIPDGNGGKEVGGGDYEEASGERDFFS